jgi:Iap family predicted aminopeptidase
MRTVLILILLEVLFWVLKFSILEERKRRLNPYSSGSTILGQALGNHGPTTGLNPYSSGSTILGS